MALAMGAENAVLETDGEVRIGLTYMTRTLVKLGQRPVGGLMSGEPLGWLPYFLLWLGVAAGGFTGALPFNWLGIGGLWIFAGGAAALAAAAAQLRPADACTMIDFTALSWNQPAAFVASRPAMRATLGGRWRGQNAGNYLAPAMRSLRTR